jgi:hypothetical protein
LKPACIVPESVYIFHDSDLTRESDYMLQKGSLAGILEIGESSSKICYLNDGSRLRTGWQKNKINKGE